MKNKNILMTGGTGFCGYWMSQTRPEGVNLFWLNHTSYQETWDNLSWDYIIHLAPISPDRVIDYAQHHRIKVLHVSTGAVYEGKGEYAENKRKWEARCLESNTDIVIARLFATSGLPFQKNKALSIFVQNALNKEPIKVWGDGGTVRSYLYGADMGRAFWNLLFNGDGIFDVGSIVSYTMLQVARMVSSFVFTPIEFVEHEEMPTPTYYVPECKKGLYCTETVDLSTAIERMIKDA